MEILTMDPGYLAGGLAFDGSGVADLETRLMGAAASESAQLAQARAAIEARVDGVTPMTTDDWLALQRATGDYALQVSMIAALTRKATSAVETVVRA